MQRPATKISPARSSRTRRGLQLDFDTATKKNRERWPELTVPAGLEIAGLCDPTGSPAVAGLASGIVEEIKPARRQGQRMVEISWGAIRAEKGTK
jgi:hypothetical protein